MSVAEDAPAVRSVGSVPRTTAPLPVTTDPRALPGTTGRTAERAEAILDAAAAIVDGIGSERLTTAAISERAGISVGALYRYYPDRLSILLALCARNRAVLRHAIDERSSLRPRSAASIAKGLVDEVVWCCEHVQSFRSLGVGVGLDLGADRPDWDWPSIAGPAVRVLVEDLGVDEGAAREQASLCIAIADSAVRTARHLEPGAAALAVRAAYEVVGRRIGGLAAAADPAP